MEQIIKLKYINTQLNIGMVTWKQVYILSPEIMQLTAEVNKGRLTYRLKGSVKRYSYNQIKKNLIKTDKCIVENYPDWMNATQPLSKK